MQSNFPSLDGCSEGNFDQNSGFVARPGHLADDKICSIEHRIEERCRPMMRREFQVLKSS